MATAPPARRPISVLMVGAGEYCCGYVATPSGQAAPDKPAGVVGLTLFDLRRRGLVGRVLLADVSGPRLAAAREGMVRKIQGVYRGLDATVEGWPADDVAHDPLAAERAMDTLARGDAVIVFTPDSTHAALAHAAIARGLHVLVAKPVVKTLAEHVALRDAAAAAGVLCAVEYHKRWDPCYADARERARRLGAFSYFYSAMTQRREQLDTFAGWAGRASDISYYLNSHHVDVHAWYLEGRGRPVSVAAAASTGVADARLGRTGIEDTITLLTGWEVFPPAGAPPGAPCTAGQAVYMASWAAPTADCHTQQAFHYMGARGELRVDQAHRGYSLSADPGDAGGTGGLQALNVLYMRYQPDASGAFAGQHGYGYRSIEAFVDAAAAVQAGATTAAAVEAGGGLATVGATVCVTAILEAGRRSLDAGGRAVRILYDDGDSAGGGGGRSTQPVGFA
jgi:D-galacturonate reductase